MRQFKFFLAALLLVFTVQNDVKAQNTYPPLIQTVSYAGLGTSANNGVVRYCRDCSGTDPCTDGGTGAFAFRVNGAWSCTGGGGTGGSLAVSGGTGILVETTPGVTASRDIVSGDGSVVIVNPDGVAGDIDVSVDSSVFSRFQTGTADATGNCTPGTFFVRTDTNESWFCTSTNTWTKLVKPAATLTANLPVIGNGTSSVTVGTRSGNTTAYVTTTGAQTSGDCVEIDANGNHIASGAACGGSGGTDLSDTTKTFYHDEFGAGLGTTGNIGDLSWTLTQIAAAGTVTAQATSTANHPGVISLVSGATDNGGPYITAAVIDAGDYASEDWDLSFLIKPDDPTTATYLSIGLSAGSPVAATSAIRAIWDTDHSHATWIFQICDSDTTGCQSAGDDTNADTVASTKVPTEDLWQRIRIRRLTSGVGGNPTIYFSVGDTGAMETEKTFCSSGCDEDLANIPTALLAIRIGVVARAAAASKAMYLDYVYMGISGQARY